jgi:[glutamine synthetase] adenylyltransferase / [glutamine synthetase]-adenylyl-L-tyrosine phosphorylase
MGKLGGGELNFSSDIDLVFLFPEAGETDGDRSLSNEEFFIRAGRQLIRLLDEGTPDGFVFRVDMRLRPFGDSGPLAMSLTAFSNYLLQHGRAWERYAYVKARAVTGHHAGMGLYRDVLRPFVFRRYLDFGLFDALRDMKSGIAAEVARRELRDNIKLGHGGIREIEFIVQCIQLLRGGADPRLRQQGLPAALARLEETGQLPPQAVTELREAWRFLRLTENRLQEWQDRQTHELPGTQRAGRGSPGPWDSTTGRPIPRRSPGTRSASANGSGGRRPKAGKPGPKTASPAPGAAMRARRPRAPGSSPQGSMRRSGRMPRCAASPRRLVPASR